MSTGWGGVLVAVVCFWVLVAVVCAPVLAFGSIRIPMSRWPTTRLPVNYLVLSGLIVLGHAATFFGGVVLTGGFSGNAVIRWTMIVAGGYPLTLWLIVGSVASATGYWESVVEELDQWLVMGLAAIWYAVVTIVVAALVFFVLFVLYFPG